MAGIETEKTGPNEVPTMFHFDELGIVLDRGERRAARDMDVTFVQKRGDRCAPHVLRLLKIGVQRGKLEASTFLKPLPVAYSRPAVYFRLKKARNLTTASERN